MSGSDPTKPQTAAQAAQGVNQRGYMALVFFIVGFNFMAGQIKNLSCTAQAWFARDLVARHLYTLALMYFVLVLFDRIAPMHPALLGLITLSLYAFFLLVARCDHRFLAVLMFAMTGVVALETTSWYYLAKEREAAAAAGASAAARGDEPPEPAAAPRWPGRIRVAQLALLALVVLATLAGMFVYLGQHAREYGKAFEWRLFWLGTPACAGNGTSVGASWVGDMLYGMRRAFIGTHGSHAARRRALP